MKILAQLELLFTSASRPSSRGKNPRRSRVHADRAAHAASADQVATQPRIGHDLLTPCLFTPRLFTPRPGRARGHVATSDEFLLTVWHNLRREFFPDHAHIDQYTVTWSPRPQKRVLASCNIRRRRIVVAQELFEPSATRWIAPVLYHEMCHAVIGEGVHLSQSGKRLWHGRQFRQLEAKHPDIEAMNAWISTGGWAMAVRSHRARRAWRSRYGSR